MNGLHVADELSLYVLDLLDERARRDVERHVRDCDHCRGELAQAEETVWTMAEAVAREPSPALRTAIVAAHGRARTDRLFRLVAPLAQPAVAFGVAAILLVASLGGLMFSQQQLAREGAIREEYAAALRDLARGARLVDLRPATGASGAGTLVVPDSGDAFLVLALPAPPSGKVYQAWVIAPGETPVPAGLAPAREGVVVLRMQVSVRPGVTVALTVEPEGGVQQPTTTPFLSGGT